MVYALLIKILIFFPSSQQLKKDLSADALKSVKVDNMVWPFLEYLILTVEFLLIQNYLYKFFGIE